MPVWSASRLMNRSIAYNIGTPAQARLKHVTSASENAEPSEATGRSSSMQRLELARTRPNRTRWTGRYEDTAWSRFHRTRTARRETS
eukprot:7386171-Prymnesium_polylepis.2